MSQFIFQDYLSDKSVCDDLIAAFEASDKKTPGKHFDKHGNVCVNPAVKDSLDLFLPHKDSMFDKYTPQLIQIAKKYMDKFPMVTTVGEWGIAPNYSLQYYKPNGGYKNWHSERKYSSSKNCNLLLAFMTYLNDVEDGGTEFYHQEMTTKAEKGSTYIWPVDWTHMHRGQISATQEKYIITGWFSIY